MRRTRAEPPLEVRWKLTGPSGRVFCCRIHRHPRSGFEVLTRYDGAFARRQWVPGLDEARQLADTWRQTILSIGGFTLLPHAASQNAAAVPSSQRS